MIAGVRRPGGWALAGLLGLTATCRAPAHDPGAGRGNYGQANAIWVQSLYFRGHHPTRRDETAGMSSVQSQAPLTDAMVVDFAESMKSGGIQYAYVFAGPFDLQGNLPPYAFGERARRTLDIIAKHHPQLVVLPWIGGVQHRQLRLDDPAWVASALAATERLTKTLGVAGVHVDMENVLFSRRPDPAYPRYVNAFVRQLRERCPRAFLSAVIPSTAPGVRPWKQRHSVEEAEELARSVDQLAVLYYDTHIGNGAAFERNLEVQVEHIARWKRASPRTQFLVALGTFVNEESLRPWRNLDVEGIPQHFAALARATSRYAERVVDGTAIYCEWETDRQEWDQLRQFLRPGWPMQARPAAGPEASPAPP